MMDPLVSMHTAQSGDGRSLTGGFVSFQAKQRAEVLQSTHKFFSDQQQQQLKAPQVSKAPRLEQAVKPPLDTSAPNHQTGSDRTDSDKPSVSTAKPIRTGPIKPQAIKPEDGK